MGRNRARRAWGAGGRVLVSLGLLWSVAAHADEHESAVPSPVPGFSADRAFADLEALVAIGPRVSGTPGAERARELLRAQLATIPSTVEEVATAASLRPEAPDEPPRTVELAHLVAELPGDSSDVIALVAPYDTWPAETFEFVGANAGASGPAVVLELGRALASAERAYTIWLVFVDGDSLGAPGANLGSRGLVGRWTESGAISRIRLAIVIDRVGDADLTIARDLRSHRSHREMIWEVARELGETSAFPGNAPFESPVGTHRAFLDLRMRRVVALVDDRFGGDESPGLYHRTTDDDAAHCSPESLGAVGRVTLESMARIQERLARIDRFATRPPQTSDERAPESESESAESETAEPESSESESAESESAEPESAEPDDDHSEQHEPEEATSLAVASEESEPEGVEPEEAAPEVVAPEAEAPGAPSEADAADAELGEDGPVPPEP